LLDAFCTFTKARKDERRNAFAEAMWG
jgi:hypothetical protein